MEPETNAAPAGDTAPEPMTFDRALDALNKSEEMVSVGALELADPAEPEAPAGEPEVEEADTAEAPEAEAAPEPDDEPEEVLHGNAKTRLRDGTVVAIADLKKAYDEAKEYRAKQADFEAKAKEFEAKQAAISQQENFFTQTIQRAQNLLRENFPAKPDERMLAQGSDAYDPIGYLEQKAKYDEAVSKWQQLEYAQKVQAQQAEAQRAAQVQQHLAREMELLKDAVPELKTEEGFKTFKSDVLTHGTKDYGFSAEELTNIGDHRALRVIRDAIAYRKLQAQKPAALEKVAKAPPVTVAPPGRRQGADEAKVAQVQEKLTAARARGGISEDEALRILNSLES